MSKSRKATAASTGPNPSYVVKVQALRFGNAAGIHKQARRPNRSADNRRSIQDSRYA